ncbi:hypothetical protein L1049_002409 [Liquidambar formosana]|uniref:Uncharacterized protein n=1 Tax=Liquidambar formosana TaxID=63359 RepID=A0AAP0R7E2_LIQFO
MAVGRDSKELTGILLAVNLVIHLIIVGLAGWSLDKYINGQQNHPHLGGNASTSFMLIFGLLGGVIGVCSVLAGFMHIRAWRSDSLASAASLALISWAIIALAFGFVVKEIILGGHRGKRLQTLEMFIIIATLSQFMYLGLLHAGVYNSRYGPGFRSHGSSDYGGIAMGHEPPKTGTTAVV